MGGRIDKEQCRALRADGASLADLAALYGVTIQSVSMACRGVKCRVNHCSKDRGGYRRSRPQEVAAQRELANELFAAGLHPKQIAYDAGLDLKLVYNRLPPVRSTTAQRLRQGAQPCA